MRRPIIAANWKMHKTSADSAEFISEFLEAAKAGIIEVVLCPPFTSLEAVSSRLRGTGVDTGAQDVHWEAKGAFTGEVSTGMLKAAGARYCIVGHSERRKLFGESDSDVGLKAASVLAAGLSPIVCVGETSEERHRGETEAVVKRQLAAALVGISPTEAARLVIAYEPVWAIGSGTPATPEDALEGARLIRGYMDATMGNGSGAAVRVQYGGSVKADNILDFLRSKDIDGALVGGASLEAKGFAALVNNAGRAYFS